VLCAALSLRKAEGKYSFVSPQDDLEFMVEFSLSFGGFAGGSGKYHVGKTAADTYKIDQKRTDLTKAAASLTYTYTAPMNPWNGGAGTIAANPWDSAWGVFHGLQDILKTMNNELGIQKNSEVSVVFPAGSTDANETNINAVLGDRYDFDVIAHEMGHAIDKQFNITRWLGAGGSDTYRTGHALFGNQYNYNDTAANQAAKTSTLSNKKGADILAFGEGMPTFWGVSLLEKSAYRGLLLNVGDKKYDDTEDASLTESLASPPVVRGEDAESALSCLLWDLSDSNDQDYANGLRDSMHLGFAGMWAILKHATDADRYENVSDFWLKNWLPGGDFTKLTRESTQAAESFVAFGMAPRITAPAKDTVIDLVHLNATEFKIDWVTSDQTGNAALNLNDFDIVIYRGDFLADQAATILWQKHVGDVNTYTLTGPEKTALQTGRRDRADGPICARSFHRGDGCGHLHRFDPGRCPPGFWNQRHAGGSNRPRRLFQRQD